MHLVAERRQPPAEREDDLLDPVGSVEAVVDHQADAEHPHIVGAGSWAVGARSAGLGKISRPAAVLADCSVGLRFTCTARVHDPGTQHEENTCED